MKELILNGVDIYVVSWPKCGRSYIYLTSVHTDLLPINPVCVCVCVCVCVFLSVRWRVRFMFVLTWWPDTNVWSTVLFTFCQEQVTPESATKVQASPADNQGDTPLHDNEVEEEIAVEMPPPMEEIKTHTLPPSQPASEEVCTTTIKCH